MIASERLGLPRLSSLTDCLPHQVRGLEAALLRAFPGAIDLILDAEVVMRATDGSVLAFGKQGAQEQKKYAGAHPALLVFDMLWLNGRDLMGRPLRERREPSGCAFNLNATCGVIQSSPRRCSALVGTRQRTRMVTRSPPLAPGCKPGWATRRRGRGNARRGP